MSDKVEPHYAMEIVRRKFAVATRKRLDEKEQEGFDGWAEREWRRSMRGRIETKIKQGRWVDVANFAMFLWNLNGRKPK